MKDEILLLGKFIALMAVSFAFVQWGRVAMSINRTVEKLPSTVEVAIASEGQLFRELLVDELSETRGQLREESAVYRKLLEREIALSRAEAIAESFQWRQATRAEAAVLRAMIAAELRGAISVADARLARVTGAAERTLNAYGEIPISLSAELLPYWNCKGNGACWPAQFTALLGAVRTTAGRTSTTMRTFEQATPSILKNVEETTRNVARITRPPTLLERVLRIAAPAAGGAVMGVLK